ncbi:hypothetical protein [Paraburkholderia phenoliruptrix]|uniref:hypothetical protein n=1 Tax=Paraburkholderia phenoliruptrix TaxID=252970 RepID=UPI0039B60D38
MWLILMNDATIFGGSDELFQFGTLLPVWTFRPRPEQTCGLPDETPVLTCAVTNKEADCLETERSDSHFTFEWVRTDDFISLNICLHLGHTRVYWVVDISDPEVYEAIELWKRAGKVPIAFFVREGEVRRQLYHVALMPPFNPEVGAHWSDARHKPTERRWEAMTVLLDTWRRLPYITKVIVGTPLRHALGNVLLTKRWERLAREGIITNSTKTMREEFSD